MTPPTFAETLAELTAVLAAARELDPAVSAAGRAILGSLRAGGKLLTCGNGGSAADALHLAEELVGRYRVERPALPAVCLNADPTALTCIGNDYGFEQVFARGVKALGRPGDVLVGFTTSGNSANVLAAFAAARRCAVVTILLAGKDGGQARGRCDFEIIVRVLVGGDVMLDHYVWGDVSRISPEAPVPVVQVQRETYTAGGAANVAHNLAALQVRTELIGIVGQDEAGTRLRALLAQNQVESGRCLVSSTATTIVKTRVMARMQQVCRIDREVTRAHYGREAETGLLPRVVEAMQGAQAVILSDYAKGVINQTVLDGILSAARQTGILVAVDPKPARQLDLRDVGLLTPNSHEALALAGLPEPVAGEAYPLASVCESIHAKYRPALLVITLGADGMALSRAGRVEQVIPTAAREVYDVSGAGDTVIATLTAALAAGAEPVAAVHLANHAAGIVVAKIGTAVVTPDELRRQIASAETS